MKVAMFAFSVSFNIRFVFTYNSKIYLGNLFIVFQPESLLISVLMKKESHVLYQKCFYYYSRVSGFS